MVQGGAWDAVIQWLSYGEDVELCGGSEIDLVTRLGIENRNWVAGNATDNRPFK